MPFKKADPNIVQFARKVRLVTDAEDAGRLDGQSKICNWLQNQLKDQVEARLCELGLMRWLPVDDEKTTKRLLSEVYSEIGLRNLVPARKEKHPFLKCVHSSPLKNIALRMAKAIAAHRKSKSGQRGGPQVGWIQYKSWAKNWTSIEYDERKGWDVAEFGWLKLSFGADRDGKRLGLKLRMVKPPKHIAQARTCRIIREGKDRYFAVFTFKKPKRVEKALARVVYIDPCHVCDHVVEGGIDPSIREWDCPQCGTHHLRDENASQNGLRKLLASLGAGVDLPHLPCSGPVQIIGRCDWRFHPQGWRGMPRGGANVNSMRLPEYRQRCVGVSPPGGDSRAPRSMRKFA